MPIEFRGAVRALISVSYKAFPASGDCGPLQLGMRHLVEYVES